MGGLKRRDFDQEGMISVVDALVFALSLLFVSIFFFNLYSASLSRTQDIELERVRDEIAINAQNHAVNYVIEETGYVNGTTEHTYKNITVERTIRNFLYLQNLEEKGGYDYDLDRLENDIKWVYSRAVYETSNYHFAVRASYDEGELFISDVLDSEEALDDPEKEPHDWSAAGHVTTLAEGEGLARIRIMLYIWV